MKKVFLFTLPAVAAFVFACSSSDKVVQVVGDSDAGAVDSGSAADDSGGAGGNQCTAAAKQAFAPVDKVSTGPVEVVSTEDDVLTIFINATAGGSGPVAATNPRVYLTFDGKQAKITDVEAPTSSDWDIAFKRAEIFTNGGDTGPGKGGAVAVDKAFDVVTAEDADGLAQEKFFDADCEVKKDEGGFLLSTFLDWYDYDENTHIPTPKKGVTYVVKSASGALFKLALLSYQGKDDGTTGGATGQWLIQVKAL